ncbi:MAG: hypothetical protein ACMG6S_19200, partial [Byssovorax sp.]
LLRPRWAGYVHVAAGGRDRLPSGAGHHTSDARSRVAPCGASGPPGTAHDAIQHAAARTTLPASAPVLPGDLAPMALRP